MADERDAMAADIEHHNDDEAVPCRQGFSARECLCLWMWIQMGVMGGKGEEEGGSSLLLMLLIQFDFCR